MSLSVLYLGPDTGTSLHRANALERIGHRVSIVNPRLLLPSNTVVEHALFRLGPTFAESVITRRLPSEIPTIQFDLVWVDGGALVGPSLVTRLKDKYGTVINFNVDDPYGNRDANKWKLYLRAVPFYDLIVVVRDCNVAEARAKGARKVLKVWRSADEVAHAPRELTPSDIREWSSEVLFVGTWMPERGPFMAKLIELGVPLAIYGDRWRKAEQWPIIKNHWRGTGLYGDEDYAKAIQNARVCLGLVSKGNRDLSTTRTFEIPLLGSVLCAERTSEHSKLYEEGREAILWSTPEECATKSTDLLRDPDRRNEIAINGRKRCIQNRATNEKVMSLVLETALAGYLPHATITA